MGLREEKKEQVRHDLYLAAIELFRERGFAETRVCDITDRVRVSPKTFFNYFATKDGVLDHMVVRMLGFFEQHLRAALAEPELDVVNWLRRYTRGLAGFFSENRRFMHLVFTRSHLFRPGGQVHEQRLKMAELFGELIRAGQANGQIRADIEPLQMVEALGGLWYFTTLNWLAGVFEQRQPLEDRLCEVVELILGGCLPNSA